MRTRISRPLTLLLLWLFWSLGEPAAAEGSIRVVGVRYSGLHRTDPAWLDEYLDLRFPVSMTSEAASFIGKKLHTTGVFTRVEATFEETPGGGPERILHIDVDEKWTTIPVIRANYGGGTPLRVLGAYDIHNFGRNIIFGAEARKYGDAPTGFVVYARAPRYMAGRYFLGIEFWRDFRLRPFYDLESDSQTENLPVGHMATNATMGRARILSPLFWVPGGLGAYPWKLGIDASLVLEAESSFTLTREAKTDLEPPPEFALNDEEERHASVMPTVLYDDVEADNVHYDGLRAEVKAGPILGAARRHAVAQAEAFGFVHWPSQWLNLAVHAYVYSSSLNSPYRRQFLGGLDSVRGLPDGLLHGTRAAFSNVELRHTSLRFKYLWIQTVAFQDSGLAGDDWDGAKESLRSTAGVGLRFAVPQIYRMVLRLDHAWSIDGKGSRGIAAGMNHFFDPYRPL